MALEDLRRLAGSWLLELAHFVWPEGRTEPVVQQAERLKARIRRGYDDLLRQRRFIESLQQRVEEYEQQAVALPWQVDAYLQVGNRAAAWRAALELDDVRHALEQARARHQECQLAYQQHVQLLARERRQLGQMQLQVQRMQSRPADGQRWACAH